MARRQKAKKPLQLATSTWLVPLSTLLERGIGIGLGPRGPTRNVLKEVRHDSFLQCRELYQTLETLFTGKLESAQKYSEVPLSLQSFHVLAQINLLSTQKLGTKLCLIRSTMVSPIKRQRIGPKVGFTCTSLIDLLDDPILRKIVAFLFFHVCLDSCSGNLFDCFLYFVSLKLKSVLFVEEKRLVMVRLLGILSNR